MEKSVMSGNVNRERELYYIPPPLRISFPSNLLQWLAIQSEQGEGELGEAPLSPALSWETRTEGRIAE